MKTPDHEELSREAITNSNIELRLKVSELTQENMTQRATIDDLTRENNELNAAAIDKLHK